MRTAILMTYHFPPLNNGASIGLAKFVKYLAENDWRMIVLTVDKRWVPSTQYSESLLQELPANTLIVRTPSLRPAMQQVATFQEAHQQIANRMKSVRSWLSDRYLVSEDYGFLWLPYSAPMLLRLIRLHNPSILWTTSPPHNIHIAGLIANRAMHIPWIVDLRDGWIGNPLFTPKSSLRRALERYLESLIMRNATQIVVRVDSMASRLANRYGGKRIAVVPNGYDLEDFLPDKTLQKANSLRGNRFTLVHVGFLGQNRKPQELFLAIHMLLAQQPEARSRFRFVNVGGIAPNWLTLADELGILSLVEYVPNIPHSEAIAYMLAADALWLIQVAADGGEHAIPSKTYEYLAARKPIVGSLCQGATRELLELTGGALCVEPGDKEGLFRILLSLYDYWRSDQDSLKQFQPDWNVVQQMTRQRSAERLAQVFNEVSRP